MPCLATPFPAAGNQQIKNPKKGEKQLQHFNKMKNSKEKKIQKWEKKLEIIQL